MRVTGTGSGLVHQLYGLVELGTGTGGTTIRLHMRLSPDPAAYAAGSWAQLAASWRSGTS
jgi:hypothetical protein